MNLKLICTILLATIVSYTNPTIPSKVIQPIQKYSIAPTQPADEATITAVQLISLNDVVNSFYRYTFDEVKDTFWAQAIPTEYTLFDWRQFRQENFTDTKDIYDNDKLTKYNMGFDPDEDVRRAITVLDKRALILENVDFQKLEAWNKTTDVNEEVKRSTAIMSLYKAVGTTYNTPPVILRKRLDNINLNMNKVELYNTTLMSLAEAQKYSFYGVWVKDARHLVYNTPNMMEGYLWDAIQDNIINATELTTDAKKYIKAFADGTYSKPLLTTDKADFMLYKLDEAWRVKENVVALNSEDLLLIDFIDIIARVLNIKGEPVLTEAESNMLVASYGAKLPSIMNKRYYDSVLYSVARGIIDDSYTAEMLYSKLKYRDMLILLSRVADKDSRLTYKYVVPEFDMSMAKQGYSKYNALVSNVTPYDVDMVLPTSIKYYDLLIPYNLLEGTPYLSLYAKDKVPSTGVLIKSPYTYNKKYYYHFRVFKDDKPPKAVCSPEDKNIFQLPTGIEKGGVLKIVNNKLVVESTTFSDDKLRILSRAFFKDLFTAYADNSTTILEFKIDKLDKKDIKVLSKDYHDWKLGTGSPATGEVLYAVDGDTYTFKIRVDRSDMKESPDSLVSSFITYTGTTPKLMAYVRKGNSDNVYYSKEFLEAEFGAVITDDSIEFPGFLMKFEDGKVITPTSIIKYDKATVALVDGTFYHSILLEQYLRTIKSTTLSTFVNTEGILYANTDYCRVYFKQLDDESVVVPALGSIDKDIESKRRFIYEGGSNTYLDLQALPPYLSNYITYWNIKSFTDIDAGVIALYPFGSPFTANPDLATLANLLGKDIKFNNKVSAVYQAAKPLAGQSATFSAPWSENESILYDKESLTMFLKLETLDSSKSIKDTLSKDGIWKMPYVVSTDKKKVFFLNLPLRTDGKMVKKDVKNNEYMFSDQMKNFLNNNSIDEVDTSEKLYMPIAPLITMFDGKESTISELPDSNNMFVFGPYTFTIANTSALNSLNTFTHLPEWAKVFYGIADATTKVKIYSMYDYNLILPTDNSTVIVSTGNILSKLGINSSSKTKDTNKANSTFKLDKFFQIDIFIDFIFLFVSIVVPIVLQGLIFLLMVLSLAIRYPVTVFFCSKVLDPFRVLSAGKVNYTTITTIHMWAYGTLAIILLDLVRVGSITQIFIKFLSGAFLRL